MTAAAPPVAANLIGLCQSLRARGWPVGIEEQHDVLRTAEAVGIHDRRALAAALRPLLCGTPEQWREFDELFQRYWFPRRGVRTRSQGPGGGLQPAPGAGGGEHSSPDRPRRGEGSADADAEPGSAAQHGASARRALGHTDFRHLHDPDENAALEALMERLARRWQRRLRRRWRIAGQRGRLDIRRTLRHSLGQGGIPVDPAFRRTRRRPPALVLLVDASRSMSVYSLRFLRLARGALLAFPQAEAFIFHTHLVRVTEAVAAPSPERMREQLALLASGWSGGTRIGESLEVFNRDHAPAVARRRGVAVILSDGLDTGSPERLAAAMAELRGRCGRVVWLNPLAGRAGYRPAAVGMRAALPYVDRLAPAHDLASLLALEDELVRL